MLSVFAFILTLISIIVLPFAIWLALKGAEGFPFYCDDEYMPWSAILGLLCGYSGFFAIILWIIVGVGEYRKPVLELSNTLDSLQIALNNANVTIEDYKKRAREAEDSVKNYETLSTNAAEELESLKSAIRTTRKNQIEIRKILTAKSWTDIILSYLFGVVTSLTATLIWHLKRKSYSMKKIKNLGRLPFFRLRS